MAKTYGTRPSSFVGVSDAWTGYQFDAACMTLGVWTESKLAERDEEGRPLHRAADVLQVAETGGESRPAAGLNPEGKPLRPFKDAISGKTIWR